ncbi:MAG: type II secretion system protein GspE [Simkaniaceae bacterium]|nr:type II secretion system protein GspE [Simkaniaceae bacterium]
MATISTKRRIGDILIDSGKITEEQLREALQFKDEHHVYLGKAITALGFLTEKEMIEILSEQLRMPYLELSGYEIQDDVLDLVDQDLAEKYKILPLFHIDDSLTVATSDPLNVQMVDELALVTNMEINLILATESEITHAIDLFYSAAMYDKEGGGEGKVKSREIDQDTEIIEAVNMLFNEAVKVGASDVHVEPREKDVRIRFRIDGVLQQHYTVPKASMAPLISRIKVMSDMDIAESRRPQDGRFSYTIGTKRVDVRASTYPTPNGEVAVMRILDQSKSKIDLSKLGFRERILEEWRRLIRLPNGIMLVSGPTGSGKTTTLYATIHVINTTDVNIMTIEDPIEYQLNNINQGMVNNKAGMTFAAALRSMLRQDPDIIMVGEMRDVETVELAIRAALTGHLVFSTIHTNSAAASYSRLVDMGLDTYMVSSTIRGILAQRLMRKLCNKCKKAYTPTDEVLKSLKIEGDADSYTFFEPVGCIHCRNSGYSGRGGVYELLVADEEIEAMINKGASTTEIQEAAEKKGMISLRKSAIHYVTTGHSSVEEVFRVTLG